LNSISSSLLSTTTPQKKGNLSIPCRNSPEYVLILIMLVPIVCFTCGVSLGDLAPIYNHIRRKRMIQRYGDPNNGPRTAPTQAAVDPSLQENLMGDVLDALRIQKCCRTHMVTAMLFTEHY
jgi:DNA-directed RNA polymerase subunit N (RpoN/RPB10)